MNNPPNAWDDEWTAAADTSSTPTEQEDPTKKQSSKVSKAQRRAEHAEFNRQLWAEAEGPRDTNYFLESRNIVPLRSEFKPPPVLLSRKGPPIIQSRRPLTDALNDLDLSKKAAESSEDEDEIKTREKTLAQRQAQAAIDREVKQRKYEERRQELFGTSSTATSASASSGLNNTSGSARPTSRSGHSTPNSSTPPGSRSATPNRGGRGRGRGRGGRDSGNTSQSRNQQRHQQQQQQQQQQQDLFDPAFAPMPESVRPLRRGSPQGMAPKLEQPVRAPKGPDGSGRGGFGFAPRGDRAGGESRP